MNHVLIQQNLEMLICLYEQVERLDFQTIYCGKCLYAEMFFTQTLWPDFSVKELDDIIEDFNKRQRKIWWSLVFFKMFFYTILINLVVLSLYDFKYKAVPDYLLFICIFFHLFYYKVWYFLKSITKVHL